jgi:hypothetical protein
MMQRIYVLVIGGTLAVHGQVLKTKDISSDGSTYIFTGAGDPGGRIKSLVIDPHHDNIVYAASEFSGVWKSTTAVRSNRDISDGSAPAMEWFQSSKGLRNGLTVNQYSLAVDQNNSQHLLYASGDDDGRPPTAAGAHRFGGLWVSVDAADNWKHAKLCPDTEDDSITSVVFTAGRPFVATGLKGHSLIRVEGPFLTLEALKFAYVPTSSTTNSVSVDVSTLGVTVKLQQDPDGTYRGRALFDSDVYQTLTYTLKVDGSVISSNTYKLTAADIANGVVTAPW